jgi:hypothetical protein
MTTQPTTADPKRKPVAAYKNSIAGKSKSLVQGICADTGDRLVCRKTKKANLREVSLWYTGQNRLLFIPPDA